jgi:hypothetical protein
MLYMLVYRACKPVACAGMWEAKTKPLRRYVTSLHLPKCFDHAAGHVLLEWRR